MSLTMTTANTLYFLFFSFVEAYATAMVDTIFYESLKLKLNREKMQHLPDKCNRSASSIRVISTLIV
jgi:hypothetical protein